MLDMSLNATVAKARAMYGKRLKEEDYRELLKRSSIADVADYLKRCTHFSYCLSSIDTNSIHRGYLEDILNRETYNEYARLCGFQKLDHVEFFNYKNMINEISEIVRCITFINAGMSDKFIETIPPYLIKHASFDLLSLGAVRNYSDLLGVIEKTPYYNIIKHEQPGEDGNYDCTVIDTKLRTYYINWVIDAVNKDFSGKAKHDMLTIINTIYDLTNIYNTFRFKAFSQAPENEIQQILLPINTRISKAAFSELVNAADADDFINKLKNVGYGRKMVSENSEMSKTTIQHDIQRLKNRYAKLYLKESANAYVCVYSILFLLSTEVNNITTIIEGIRYGVPSQYIENFLVMV